MKSISRFTFLITLLILTNGCGLTERITKNRTVRIDTVYKDVSLPEHNFARQFHLQDSLFFEDERLAVSLTRSKPSAPPSDTDTVWKEIGAQKPNLWTLQAQVKPDTVRVPVHEKTVTENKQTTRYVKQTPKWMWAIVGGLVMLILVVVVAWKISAR